MDLDKIPHKLANPQYHNKDVLCDVEYCEFINNFKYCGIVFDSKKTPLIKYKEEIHKFLIDSKYVVFDNYYEEFTKKNITKIDYFEGDNTIQMFNYKSKYDDIINQKHITTLKIYIYQEKEKNEHIKLINNLPVNIVNLCLINYNDSQILDDINFPITLNYINIIQINPYCTNKDLQKIIDLKIPFNCSLNCVFYEYICKIYTDLEKYKS